MAIGMALPKLLNCFARRGPVSFCTDFSYITEGEIRFLHTLVITATYPKFLV